MQTIQIAKADEGGYIVTDIARVQVFPTLDALFTHLLQTFEGRAPTFTRDYYGTVKIDRLYASNQEPPSHLTA